MKNSEYQKALQQVDNIRNLMIPKIISRMEQKLEDQSVIFKNLLSTQLQSYNKHLEKLMATKVGQNMLRGQVGIINQKLEQIQKTVMEYKQTIDYKLDSRNKSYTTLYSNILPPTQNIEQKQQSAGKVERQINEVQEEEQSLQEE